MPIVLGSGSPRRAELLSQIGIDYIIQRPDIDEQMLTSETPSEYVRRMSDGKHAAVRELTGDEQVILTADTVVVLGSNVLGKPRNQADGLDMLRNLSGQRHQVMTSVTLGVNDRDVRQFLVETYVQFRTLTNQECEAYWRTGEPADKAGGYGIQGIGAILIESIEGSYTNVVGLPLTETAHGLRQYGFEVLK